jgi:hypothetical protein
VTDPVKAEYETARDYGKPILAFRKEVSSRLPEVEEMLRSLGSKWDSFTDSVELREHLRTALGMELLRLIRGDGHGAEGHGDRVARLRRFVTDGAALRVSPLIPQVEYNLFSVTEVQAQTVVFKKQSSHDCIGVPLQRVVEILDQGDNEPPHVILQGRIQWLTLKREWGFFPESPVDKLGVPRDVDFSSQTALMAAINASGRVPLVSPLDLLARRLGQGTHEVVYDDNGYYLRHSARDTDSVLVVAK